MNNIKKSIFKTQTDSTPSPPVNVDTYAYGTYACIGGTVNIGSPTPGGNVYYQGDLSVPFPYDVSGVFSDPALTIPIPHDYIRTNAIPRYYITVDTGTGAVSLIQPEGDPC